MTVRSRPGGLLIVVFGSLLLLSSPAVAQTPTTPSPPPSSHLDASPAPDEARQLIRQGNRAYNAGEFEKALGFYQRAYELRASAGALFNMAQCNRQLKRNEKALFLYKSYLRVNPDARNRQVVETIIAELYRLQQAAPSTGSAAEQGTPAATPSGRAELLPGPSSPSASPLTAGVSATSDSEPSRPWYRRWYVWTAIGAAVVAGVVAGVVVGTRGGGGADGTDLGGKGFFGGRVNQ